MRHQSSEAYMDLSNCQQLIFARRETAGTEQKVPQPSWDQQIGHASWLEIKHATGEVYYLELLKTVSRTKR